MMQFFNLIFVQNVCTVPTLLRAQCLYSTDPAWGTVSVQYRPCLGHSVCTVPTLLGAQCLYSIGPA